MKTCETCKHWMDKNNNGTYAICWCPKFTEGCADDDKCDSLVYSYCEGGYFETGKNFGCVHHEEKA